MSREMFEHNERGYVFRVVVSATVPLGYDWGTLVGSFGKAIEGPEVLNTYHFGPYQLEGVAKARLRYLVNHGLVQSCRPNLHIREGRVERARLGDWESL